MANPTIPGFSFEGQGTFERIETYTPPSGKEILTIIVRVDGQYPQIIPFKVFGHTADDAREIAPGTMVHITGRLGGREAKGRVWGDHIATHINVLDSAKSPPRQQEPPPPSDDDELGF